MQFVSIAAVKQYDDLKYSGNYHDAFHLSCDLASYQQDTFTPKHSERSGIYCGALSLVKSGSAQLISVQSQIWHSSGIRIKSDTLRKPDFMLSLLGSYTLQAANAGLIVYAAFHKKSMYLNNPPIKRLS